MKKVLVIMGMGLVAALGANAMTVSDPTTHSLISAQTSQQLSVLQNSLSQAQQAVSLATRARDVMGDPAAALGMLGNASGLNVGGDQKTMDQLSSIGSSARSLSGQAQNLFQPINFNSLSNSSFTSSNPQAKYSAVESAFNNYSTNLNDSQNVVAKLRQKIDQINSQTVSTEAEQRQKQADLAALNAKLADAQKQSQDAYNQLSAQKILNDNERELQEEAVMKQSEQNLKATLNAGLSD